MSAVRIPFSVVDELCCYFERPGEPNNIHLEVAVAGRLDPAQLRAAVARTLADHPRARVRRGRWHWYSRRFWWEAPEVADLDPVATVHCPQQGTLGEHRAAFLAAAPPVDLAPPLRLLHVRRDEGDVVILNAHHAAFDGMSCLRLLRSVARNYAGRPDPVPEIRGGPPEPRGGPPEPPGGPPARPARWARPVLPARIAAETDQAVAGGYGLRTLTLSALPTGMLSGPAPGADGEPAATVNDRLLAALFLAVGSWNRKHGRTAELVRITMPVNARPPHVAGEFLGNLSRLTTISATAADCADPLGLLARVAAQTRAAKQAGAAPPVGPMAPVFGGRWLPVPVKAALAGPLRRLGAGLVDTVLLSNLGRIGEPLEFGAAGPATRLLFSVPAPMPRGLSIGVATTGEQLHLCFRYHRALLDDAAAARFTTAYLRALDSLVCAVPHRSVHQ